MTDSILTQVLHRRTPNQLPLTITSESKGAIIIRWQALMGHKEALPTQ
ncbi:hypothetical protein XF_1193 [Xylella fastidiosa 9a5c]|uniref:Uncharacterized protein n=1 Tax=Xylella fastidiosa (strain 9a5c) TaxID=160492 RepID=Q9PE35_XYLFA|nr:hypothetical protein XF_1193 [Xylella fastidiosa 9a5c]